MNKFGRTYVLKVETKDQSFVEIQLPLSIEFDIKRKNLASANTATFKIYNLSEKIRNILYLDRWNTTAFRAIQFNAGYGLNYPLLFNGNIKSCFSHKPGTNFITEIEAFDGGYSTVNGNTSMQFGANISQKEVLNRLALDLPKLQGEPIIGDFVKKYPRGAVYCGNTWELIKTVSESNCFIDNRQLKVLKNNEALKGDVSVINSTSGLLSTPRRSDGTLEFEILFEPRLTVGQVVELQSTTNKLFNGQYKISGFQHAGIISPVVSGECKTTATLNVGELNLDIIKGTAVQ